MPTIENKPWVYRLTGGIRNFTNRKMFAALSAHSKGSMLDVGGWDFFLTAKEPEHHISFTSWTTLEVESERLPAINDSRFRVVVGDGCATPFDDAQFDTYLNVCVLEHVYEPIKMVKEAARVLKKGGVAIFLIPQTTLPHMVPHHYYNFTRYWIEKVMIDSGFNIKQLSPIGGLWQNVIAHFFYFVMYTLRAPDHNVVESKHTFIFWVLMPFMTIYALISLPICLIFGVGDLTEGARHYLVVVEKK